MNRKVTSCIFIIILFFVVTIGNCDEQEWSIWDHIGFQRWAIQDENDKIGIVDNEYNVIVEPVFDFIWYYSEDLCAVEINNYISYVDREGAVCIPFLFRGLPSAFSNGVSVIHGDNNVVIDREGNILLSRENCDIEYSEYRDYGMLTITYNDGPYVEYF